MPEDDWTERIVPYEDSRTWYRWNNPSGEMQFVGMRWRDLQGFAVGVVAAVIRGDVWTFRIGGCPEDTEIQPALEHVWKHGAKGTEKMARSFFSEVAGNDLIFMMHVGGAEDLL